MTEPFLNQHYKIHNGVWFYKGKVLIDPEDALCGEIFYNHRDSLAGGHSGYHRELHRIRRILVGGQSGYHRELQRIRRTFWWSGMIATIKQKVCESDICQRNKNESVSQPGLLGPLPIPAQVWNHISMDFIEGLPVSQGKTSI